MREIVNVLAMAAGNCRTFFSACAMTLFFPKRQGLLPFPPFFYPLTEIFLWFPDRMKLSFFSPAEYHGIISLPFLFFFISCI